MIVVTACNERYLPGVVALWNSFKAHHDTKRHDFWCIAFGEMSLIEKLELEEIPYVHGKHVPIPEDLPAPGVWKDKKFDRFALQALYCRVVLPKVFSRADRILWVDADCNFVGSVADLDAFRMQGKAVGACLTARLPKIYKAMGKAGPVPLNIKTGTMLFDVKRYNQAAYPERMIEFIAEQGDKFDDSTVNCAVNWVIGDDVVRLPDTYSFNAKMLDPPSGAKILHWSICDPWDVTDKPKRIQDRIKEYWEPYR